jgi:hypothetical protein
MDGARGQFVNSRSSVQIRVSRSSSDEMVRNVLARFAVTDAEACTTGARPYLTPVNTYRTG